MTVRKLISILEKMPPSSRIFMPRDSYNNEEHDFVWMPVEKVRMDDIHHQDSMSKVVAYDAVMFYI